MCLLLLFHLLLISIFCAFDGARTLIDWLQIWWDGVHRQFEESLNFRRFFFALFVPPVWVQSPVLIFTFFFVLPSGFLVSLDELQGHVSHSEKLAMLTASEELVEWLQTYRECDVLPSCGKQITQF